MVKKIESQILSALKAYTDYKVDSRLKGEKVFLRHKKRVNKKFLEAWISVWNYD